jgi:hypothetical protein
MKTLSEAMERLVRRGFTTFGSRDVIIREYDRFEGVSDPDDMAILYALESSSGVRGTLVDAFGVYSNPAISAYLKRVPFAGVRSCRNAEAPLRSPHASQAGRARCHDDDEPGSLPAASVCREPP